MTSTRLIALLIFLSAVNLVLMVPGGFVETRAFPGYSVAVLAAFNVFLTVLGLGSLVLAYWAYRFGRVGMSAPAFGAAFAAVYLLDLAHIFPISQVPMSAALYSLEWVGTILGLGTLVLGLRHVLASHAQTQAAGHLPGWLMAGMGALALGIVIFATMSAR